MHLLEGLERRQMLSAQILQSALPVSNSLQIQSSMFRPTYEVMDRSGSLVPLATAGPQGYSPAEIRSAYGLNQVSFNGVAGNGAGQTIAIIDAYNDPNIRADLHAFDVTFGLADPNFSVVAQDGSANLPGVDPVPPGGANFEGEIALDVEWAHALAPGANILQVEARDATPSNLFAAANFARQAAGVSVISMSFGGNEAVNETQFDSIFATPANHIGVTFIASTGDSGVPAGYPAYSPNVLATGGTSLSIDANGNYQSESGWSGSGGGISNVEAQPSFQRGVVTQSTSLRTAPDVAFDSDPRTGFAVFDSYNNGTSTPWEVVGGTSAAAPAWSGLIAVVNQGRTLGGKNTLDGRSQTLPLIYSAPAADFHDITTGNNGVSASAGYDLVTGRGSPRANLLIPFLISGTIAPPPPVTAGASIASISASASTVVEGSSLVLTANGVSDPGGTGVAVTFYEETNGVAGLQTDPTSGDFAFSAVTDGSNSITLDTSNVTGAFAFYAQVTDAQGHTSATGTSAPSVTVNVVAPSNAGPSIASLTATPNPVITGNTVTVQANGITDPNAAVRRVYIYEETNGIPGLQTGFGGDFAFRPSSSASGFAVNLDTTGVTGLVTFYGLAVDSLGDVSATGTDAPSVTVNVVTGAVPDTPANLTATAVSPSEIDLAFTETDSGQTGFTIERSLDPTFATFSKVFTINRPDALSYEDTGLTGNTHYFYRVQANGPAGASAFSNVAGATTPAPNLHMPFGTVDKKGPAILAGWADDPDTSGAALQVTLTVDGTAVATTTANLPRLDLVKFFGSANHGYSFDLTKLTPGIHRIDVSTLDTGNGHSQLLGSLTIDTNRPPRGGIDLFNGSTLAGWAFDPEAGASSIEIQYVLDNNAPVLATASDNRPDLAAAVGSTNHGFVIALPQLSFGAHLVSLFGVDPATNALTLLGRRVTFVTGPGGASLPRGSIDIASTGHVAGWALNTAEPATPLEIRVDVDGTMGTPAKTDMSRPDVNALFQATGNHGFDQALSLSPGEHRIDVYAVDPLTGRVVLLGSRMVLPAAANGMVAGSIDKATASEIAGWAWSSAQAPAGATVRIEIDNLAMATITTTIARPDLPASLGQGNFGFSVNPPDLSPGVHAIKLLWIDPLTLLATTIAQTTLTVA